MKKAPKTDFDALNFLMVRLIPIVLNRSSIKKASTQHVAMSEDRIITGIEVTDGSKPDGAQLPILLDKSKQNGAPVKEIGRMSAMTIWLSARKTM